MLCMDQFNPNVFSLEPESVFFFKSRARVGCEHRALAAVHLFIRESRFVSLCNFFHSIITCFFSLVDVECLWPFVFYPEIQKYYAVHECKNKLKQNLAALWRGRLSLMPQYFSASCATVPASRFQFQPMEGAGSNSPCAELLIAQLLIMLADQTNLHEFYWPHGSRRRILKGPVDR